MGRFKELDVVRVRRLLAPKLELGPDRDGYRAPQVGDEGTVVWVEGHPAGGARYTVESVDPDGYTVWLADFEPDELEAVPTPSPPGQKPTTRLAQC
jgi:hypothetical protein